MSTSKKKSGQTVITVPITTEFIELNQLLKLAGLVDSGAAGKHLVASGVVQLDGQPESRKTAKIRPGQKVSVERYDIKVVASDAREST